VPDPPATPAPPVPGRVLWTPGPEAERSQLARFQTGLRAAGAPVGETYDDLWRWSTTDLDAFWTAVWRWLGVVADGDPAPALAADALPGAVWFPSVRVNYAEQVLGPTRARPPADVAVIGRSQTRPPLDLTWAELADQVARARNGLQQLGVGRGDRVAAYLPNVPETVVAFLAAASLGAVWSSCAPEFGVRSVVDRFGQIAPSVLLAVDGYRYGARDVDRRGEVAEIRAALPTLRATVSLPYLGADPLPDTVTWDDLLAEPARLAFERVPFDHPLYVLFSSGTTGLPKAIVHGHGGIALEHGKALALQSDLGPGDRFSWFTTTGWMMWNLLVSGLEVGATIVCFDGDPTTAGLAALWHLADETRTTYLGLSASFIAACNKAGLRPRELCDLSRLRAVGSTGSPLTPEGFEWVHDAVSPDIPIASISGGTDVCTALVGHAPTVPVRSGEIACRWLGAAVAAVDDDGRPLVGVEGEMVVTRPMPSMPVGLWDDPDGARLRAAYFERFPGIWHQGDWITITEHGSCVVSGRSDATLNRGGVRLGTSEFYAVVEGFAEVRDSLVVHLDDPAGGPGELLLFVVPAIGDALAPDVAARITDALRTQLSPRHVPDAVIPVAQVPRTLSGKKLEVPMKRILRGARADDVASRGSLADPSALEPFERMAAERAASPG
jgi:acetoacetyl-CoA synthetase